MSGTGGNNVAKQIYTYTGSSVSSKVGSSIPGGGSSVPGGSSSQNSIATFQESYKRSVFVFNSGTGSGQ